MKPVIAAVLACITILAVTEGALAQAKKKDGQTCSQRCSAFCNSGGKHANCFDKCSSRCR